jgi:hypothetical protein
MRVRIRINFSLMHICSDYFLILHYFCYLLLEQVKMAEYKAERTRVLTRKSGMFIFHWQENKISVIFFNVFLALMFTSLCVLCLHQHIQMCGYSDHWPRVLMKHH